MNVFTDWELRKSFERELEDILTYWATYTVDPEAEGFYGAVDDHNLPVAGATKGAVLNARILWSFSAAYSLTGKDKYLRLAGRAYRYINKYFIDPVFGGVFWSLNDNGSPADVKKQVYAQAFVIYGFAAYYKASGNSEALSLAKKLYCLIEAWSYDVIHDGYFEAFSREWKPIDDLRLSAKDANEKKTANTHLHILEAYSLLYTQWPDKQLGEQLRKLISNFKDHLIDKSNYHLRLFLDENWNSKSETISYGHDIEAAWLLYRAAESLQDEQLIAEVGELAIRISHQISKCQNADGSLNYEFEPTENHMVTDRHWWVQAEAVVGFYNAWQITGETRFKENALAAWNFTTNHLIDRKKGEWYRGVEADGKIIPGYGKAGFWKCPYHNSRVCMEMIGRVGYTQLSPA